MYENYLLDTEAIAAVLNTTEDHTKQISDTDIQEIIERCLDDPKYFKPLDKNRGIDWIRADVVLKDVFRKAAELEFRKTTHSVELTKWLIDNAPEKLKEISDAIGDALGFR